MAGDHPNDVLRQWNQFQRQIGTIAGGTAVKWFKGNFKAQGFRMDRATVKWKARSSGAKRNRGRSILVDTGRLRRSIRIVRKGPHWAVVGTDVPYAAAHNSGLRKTGTAQVNNYFRRSRKGKLHQVKPHKRKLNINIPKRQFLGNSEGLNREIAREFTKRLARLGLTT